MKGHKLSARQRELLTKMAAGWFISGHASFPEWEWGFEIVDPDDQYFHREEVSPWAVLRLKDIGFIMWDGGNVTGSFVIYRITDAGRAALAADSEQEGNG